MPMGFSFQPGADAQMGGANGANGRSVSAPDSSVKVLNMRMPKYDMRGQGLAPSALLNASGQGGVQTGGLSPQLLAMLLQAFSANPQGGGGAPDLFGGGEVNNGTPAGGFGAPRVIPGGQDERLRLNGPSVPGLQTGSPETFDRTQPGSPRIDPGPSAGSMGGMRMPLFR